MTFIPIGETIWKARQISKPIWLRSNAKNGSIRRTMSNYVFWKIMITRAAPGLLGQPLISYPLRLRRDKQWEKMGFNQAQHAEVLSECGVNVIKLRDEVA